MTAEVAMREISLNEISFRNIGAQDMPLLEKWYAMTDQLGYATGFKSLDEVREKILSDTMISLLIILDGRLTAGFVCCELRNLNRRHVAWIHIMLVDPAFQNRGIGTEAVSKLLRFLASMGATAALASVSERNQRGLGFWKSLGFERSFSMEKILSTFGTSGVAIMKKALTGTQT